MGSKKKMKTNWLTELKDKYKEDRFFDEVFKVKVYGEVKKVEKKDVVVDIGALAGEFSFYIYDQAKKIYAIEPCSEHFEELKENVEKYKLKKIKPFKLAIAGINGDIQFYKDAIEDRGGGSTVSKNKKFCEIVPAVTLATFISNNEIKFVDILKIDVEDAEDQIFSAPDFKKVVDKIGFIIGEHLGDNPKKILEEYGFTYRQGKHHNSVFYKK